MPTDELITALGEAVAAVWGKLPAEVQQALFEAAKHRGGAPATLPDNRHKMNVPGRSRVAG
jgi:hypothetical protein